MLTTASNKIRTACLLAAISFLVVLLFQWFYLERVYRGEFNSLRREVQIILRETTLNRQIRFIMNNDSMFRSRRFSILDDRAAIKKPDSDSFKIRFSNTLRVEPSVIGGDIRNETERTDSLIAIVPVHLEPKDLQSIDSAYKKALTDARIYLPYQLALRSQKVQLNNIVITQPESSSISREIKMRNRQIAAVFESPRWLIFSKMKIQLFSSSILLALIGLSFLWMINNLRRQMLLTEQKNNLISNITHELKTPIATVSVAIEALQNFNAAQNKERTKEYLDISAAELQRLNLLVDKVLRLSMFENNSINLHPEVVDLTALIDAVVASMKLQFEKAGVYLKFERPVQLQHYVYADKMHLQSVIYNLLDNAMKYGGNPAEINIALQGDNENIRLEIADNGAGIADEHKDKIFEKFYRVPAQDTHNVKGYGLGLSYVAEVLKRMDSRITVHDNQPGGTRFVVIFKTALRNA